MDSADGEFSDQEDYDVVDDMDQEEYFPFDDEPGMQQFSNGASGNVPNFSSVGGGAPPLQPSSNLPLSQQLIASLNQNILMQAQTAGGQSHSQMTAYQYQVMQSQTLAHEVAMLNQSPAIASAPPGMAYIPGVADGVLDGGTAAPGTSGAGSPWTMVWGTAPPAVMMGGPSGGSSGFSSAAATAHSQMFAQMHRTGGHWDPSGSRDWDATKASDLCLGRIARDLHSLYTDPIPGIMVHANENDVTRMLALIKGPEDTPYDGGFFQFFLRCPPDYPISSPRVKLLTTGGGTVRFNPNLYANGKVCLSLLGTWAGPQWSPALNISSLLLSIQSLMCDFPYKNEPGYEKVSNSNAEVVKYNHVIRHETIRVAVIEMVKEALRTEPSINESKVGAGDSKEQKGLPSSFRTMILRGFLDNHDKYLAICAKEKNGLPSGATMPVKVFDKLKQHMMPMSNLSVGITAFCGDRRGTFNWESLAKELTDLKGRVEFEVANLDGKVAARNGTLDDGEDELKLD